MLPFIITNESQHLVIGPHALHEAGVRLGTIGGCKPRMWLAGQMPKVPLATELFDPIPRSEWPALIKAGAGTWLHDIAKPHLAPHDQAHTNFCWAHGPVRCFEVLRIARGFSPRRLSSASIAVPITGGRNIGGYPEKAMMQLQSQGACSIDLWPDTQLKKSPEALAFATEAKRNRLVKWIDVQGFDMQMSCLLRRIPLVLPLNWWGHCVAGLDPYIDEKGEFGIGFDNSWGEDFGDYGYAYLDEEHGTAEDGAYAPIEEGFSP